MRTGSTRILFPLFLSLLAMGGVARGQEGWSEPEVLAEGAGTFMESSQIRDGLTFPTAMAQDGDRLVFVGPTAEGLWYRPAGDPAEVLPVEVFSPDDLGPWGWEAGEDEEGNLALGYAFLTPTGVSLHARRKLPGGGFSDEEPLHDFPTAGPAIMGSPSMALAPDGTWHVTYRTTEYVNFPDPKATVRLYYFTPGSEPKLVLEQVEEFDISQTALNPRYQGESIAVASTGEVYVAYGNRTDANDRGTGFVRVLRRNAGTGEFEETQAIDADGAPVLRFDDNDGAHLLLNSSLKTAPATPTPGPNETQIESTDHTQVFYVNAAAPDAPVLLAEGEELTLSEPGTFFLGFTGISVHGTDLLVESDGRIHVVYSETDEYSGDFPLGTDPGTFHCRILHRVWSDDGGGGVAGDVNGDDVVNAVDVQLTVNVLLGLVPREQFPGADVSGDGTVNAVDIQLVVNALLGVG